MQCWLHGVPALRLHGIIQTRLGHVDEATESFERGLRLARSMPFPYGEAQVLHAYGLLERQPRPAGVRGQQTGRGVDDIRASVGLEGRVAVARFRCTIVTA